MIGCGLFVATATNGFIVCSQPRVVVRGVAAVLVVNDIRVVGARVVIIGLRVVRGT